MISPPSWVLPRRCPSVVFAFPGGFFDALLAFSKGPMELHDGGHAFGPRVVQALVIYGF